MISFSLIVLVGGFLIIAVTEMIAHVRYIQAARNDRLSQEVTEWHPLDDDVRERLTRANFVDQLVKTTKYDGDPKHYREGL